MRSFWYPGSARQPAFKRVSRVLYDAARRRGNALCYYHCSQHRLGIACFGLEHLENIHIWALKNLTSRMLSRQIHSSTITIRSALRSHRPAHAVSLARTFNVPARGYARSRYPDSGPGTSRTRERAEPSLKRRRPFEQDEQHEQQPSVEESPLWQASQRPPAGNPEEGLKRLLMDNEQLVVTR